jgi:hypothetical protein
MRISFLGWIPRTSRGKTWLFSAGFVCGYRSLAGSRGQAAGRRGYFRQDLYADIVPWLDLEDKPREDVVIFGRICMRISFLGWISRTSRGKTWLFSAAFVCGYRSLARSRGQAGGRR